MSRRIDMVMVERGLAPSRTKAQALIAGGMVEIFQNGKWSFAHSPSQMVTTEEIRVKEDSEELRFVSRAGLKLEGALNKLQLDVTGWRCLDVGLSTGGFTDCLLKRGAKEVCGFDVGHGQLAKSLRTEPRLRAFEGVHVKDLKSHDAIQAWLKSGLDLCVIDVSFISLVQVLPLLTAAIPPAPVLALVKPQFEVGVDGVDKRGLADPKLFDDVKRRVLLALQKCGLSTKDYFPSDVKGQDGNQEFFVFAHRS